MVFLKISNASLAGQSSDRDASPALGADVRQAGGLQEGARRLQGVEDMVPGPVAGRLGQLAGETGHVGL